MHATVHPRTAVAGAFGTWIIRLTPDRTLPPGATIRLELPSAWYTTELNLAKGVHSVDPGKPNYLGLRYPPGSASLAYHVEGGTTNPYTGVNERTGLDGRARRYVYVIRVQVLEGHVEPGAPIDVVVGDRSAGSPGFRAGTVATGAEPIHVAVDYRGDGHAALLPDTALPTVTIVPGPLAGIEVVVPSDAQVGTELTASAVGLDNHQNAVPLSGVPSIHVVAGAAEVGAFTITDRGAVTWPVRPTATGVLRLEVRAGRTIGRSNPALCTVDSPAVRTYWGDLHSHAAGSYDAVGAAPYTYARDVARLDFYALTEHTETWGADGERRWADAIEAAAAHHLPGRFVTLHAYESTLDAPYGHHNVYFRDRPNLAWPLVSRDHDGTLAGLWSRLTEGEALTVPHHTGIAWPQRADLPGRRSAPAIDWTIRHDAFRTLTEVYSSHGQSETYDPHHPAAYERMSDWSPSSYSTPGPHYAHDGWLTGQRLGLVAGSDNHSGQPGRSHTGLTAAIAPDLSRESIFDAMRTRHVYATTGQRIIVQMNVDGAPMGAAVPHAASHVIRLHVVGTDDLDSVLVFRGDLDRRTVEVAAVWRPSGDSLQESWTDSTPPRHGFYYVRIQQRQAHRGRAALAWSSPTWIEPPD